jgi:hypothetical protein
VLTDGVLSFADTADTAVGGGRSVGVLEDLDGAAFTEAFLAAVAAAHR